MSTRRASIAFALTAAACAVPASDSFDANEQPVEAAYWPENFALDQGSLAIASTGVLFAPDLNQDPGRTPVKLADGTPVVGTCGVTFISPHYAITAAHCISKYEDSLAPDTQTFAVEQYDVSAINWSKVSAAETIAPLSYFPNYQHPSFGAADGYKVTRYSQCRLVARCGGAQWGDKSCPLASHPISVAKDPLADIELIKCDDRASNAPYMGVAQSDPATGAVEMTWFHEYLDMPTSAPVAPAPGSPFFVKLMYGWNLDRFDHYTLHATHATNYHYLGGKSQLLPWRSVAWGYGVHDVYVSRARLGNDATHPVVWTDMYGCHGTSGSGAYQINAKGKPELLGPISVGGQNFYSGGVERLCVDTSNPKYGMGQPTLAYTALPYTRLLAKIAFDDPNEFPIVLPWPYPTVVGTASPPLPAPPIGAGPVIDGAGHTLR